MIAETAEQTARAKRMPLPGTEALSIAEFCAANGISQTTFFKMRREGTAPRVMKLGTRVLISQDAARAWREALTEPERAA
jgi:predicted DNA-binding transcriptional regulator AlpA